MLALSSVTVSISICFAPHTRKLVRFASVTPLSILMACLTGCFVHISPCFGPVSHASIVLAAQQSLARSQIWLSHLFG